MDVVKMWEHAGMMCVMRRGYRGIPCGYVALPEEHPLHGVRYQDMDEIEAAIHTWNRRAE